MREREGTQITVSGMKRCIPLVKYNNGYYEQHNNNLYEMNKLPKQNLANLTKKEEETNPNGPVLTKEIESTI